MDSSKGDVTYYPKNYQVESVYDQFFIFIVCLMFSVNVHNVDCPNKHWNWNWNWSHLKAEPLLLDGKLSL